MSYFEIGFVIAAYVLGVSHGKGYENWKGAVLAYLLWPAYIIYQLLPDAWFPDDWICHKDKP